ncbi:transcription antitermination factor NusB [Alicyclobacillus mali]|uniref:Transcription antitermination protein NusB n=1 Tax=Alicyclobacillus mali (ex Roth et al. 2021) TaxID=1123961 RepID=A0ABS0F608_9BACL|nr:transcription antitermination factor NusB [Alicyclobacillus mali (ex Roth et al. 2021)]MBF8378708.1 transcription antitermination factor NusB [Alicyclobacillus mali (ex Roth et al. 2021)]MCL6487735.1 transcription antitermination factor NusB [Alicyclobacillus mali (ex Roth et al. 2021)]
MTRHEARECALQALCVLDVQPDLGSAEAIASVLAERGLDAAGDGAYLETLVDGTRRNLGEIDELLARHMERWSPERIGRVERNVLRLATYELLYEPELPIASAIDEAVQIAKTFATEQSGRFVNGVLAKLLPAVTQQRAEVILEAKREAPRDEAGGWREGVEDGA